MPQPELDWEATGEMAVDKEHNKRVALAYFDAFVKGDAAWWKQNVLPSFKRHDPGLPYEVVGPEGLQRHHDVLLNAVPDLNLPVHTVLADDDKVLVCLRFRGTHKGELFGHEATGNAIDVEVFDLFRFLTDALRNIGLWSTRSAFSGSWAPPHCDLTTLPAKQCLLVVFSGKPSEDMDLEVAL